MNTKIAQEPDEPPADQSNQPEQARERRCATIILAGGQSTRIKSRLSKLLHPVAGRPMIDIVLDAARGCAPRQKIVVIGHNAEQLRQHLEQHPESLVLALQEEQLGTGHATLVGLEKVGPDVDDIVVIFSDQPLITPEMVLTLLTEHRRSGAKMTTAACIHPTGGQHGRITRDARGKVIRITQARDAVGEQPGPKEIDSGIFCFRRDWLAARLPLVPRQPHGEYYLTDLVAMAASEATDELDAPWPVAAAIVDCDAAMGVNDRVQLAVAERYARQRINERLMLSGVTITDPASTFIDADVIVGRDTIIAPFTIITGQTVIGENCRIGPSARISDSTIANGCTIVDSTIEQAEIGEGSDVGPYAHFRPGVRLGERVHVGNYVELKNTTVGADTAIGHVSYLGDSTVGERVNIGAGVITANYDGQRKHRTTIGDGAFIGVDTMLRAPIEVGPGAVTGAGAVVTRDIPAGRKAVGVPARLTPPHASPIPASPASSTEPQLVGDMPDDRTGEGD